MSNQPRIQPNRALVVHVSDSPEISVSTRDWFLVPDSRMFHSEITDLIIVSTPKPRPVSELFIRRIGELLKVCSADYLNRRRVREFVTTIRSFLAGLFRQKQTVKSKWHFELESFSEASMAWLREFSGADSKEIERAKLIINAMEGFYFTKGQLVHERVTPLVRHIQNGYLIRNTQKHFIGTQDEFDGLVLYLAARFTGSTDWLEQQGADSTVLFVSTIYEALRSNVIALFRCAKETRTIEELPSDVITEQLYQYGLSIEQSELGSLKACLIQTPFGSTVYLNRGLSPKQRELACFHELAHHVLCHRSGSEFGLDPELLESTGLKDQFVRQEKEANGFAELWRHVLYGFIEYLVQSSLRVHESEIAIERTTSSFVSWTDSRETIRPEASMGS